jgi:hypothetical protein
MTKTERWYAIVEELRASAPRLCSYGFQRLRLRPSASCCAAGLAPIDVTFAGSTATSLNAPGRKAIGAVTDSAAGSHQPTRLRPPEQLEHVRPISRPRP